MLKRFLALTLLSPALASAQAPKTFFACYVPAVGAMYLIKATGVPSACLTSSHVEITWTEGSLADGGATTAKLADGAVTTVKLADGAVTAAKLSADVNSAIVSDGSITPAKLSFDPATQAELDAQLAALGTVGTLNDAANPLEWTRLKSVPSFSLASHDHGLGNFNTRIGLSALSSITTGFSNTAVGDIALVTNTTGSQNTAVGPSALRFNVSTMQNVAVGPASLRDHTAGDWNTSVGSFSMPAHTSGQANTALGQAALNVITTGSNNTAIGRNSAAGLTSGSDNTFIGRNAGVLLTSGSGNVYINNDGQATENDVLRIGAAQTRAFIAGVSGVTTALAGLAVFVDANGQLGTVSSSRRFKQDIADMGNASARLMQLRPVMFRYRQRGDSSAMEYGLIAEEVADKFPELVVRGKDGEVETVRYSVLSTLLLNEVQRQERELAALRQMLEELRAERGKR